MKQSKSGIKDMKPLAQISDKTKEEKACIGETLVHIQKLS